MESEVIIIDKDGDLLLQVAKGYGPDAPTTEIRVCSRTLMRASRILRRLILLNKTADSISLMLFVDVIDEMEDLLKIAHSHFADVLVGPAATPDYLYGLVTLANKYDMVHLLRP
ncbi:putative BTB domain-containing protein [Seiridium cardinale]